MINGIFYFPLREDDGYHFTQYVKGTKGSSRKPGRSVHPLLMFFTSITYISNANSREPQPHVTKTKVVDHTRLLIGIQMEST